MKGTAEHGADLLGSDSDPHTELTQELDGRAYVLFRNSQTGGETDDAMPTFNTSRDMNSYIVGKTYQWSRGAVVCLVIILAVLMLVVVVNVGLTIHILKGAGHQGNQPQSDRRTAGTPGPAGQRGMKGDPGEKGSKGDPGRPGMPGDRDLWPQLSVSNGQSWGDWAPCVDYCPANSHAAGFKLKVEDMTGDGDETGLNAIQLICQPPGDGSGPSSAQSGWGEWKVPLRCKQNSYLVAFQLRVEEVQHGLDDTAVNNINFKCKDMNNTNDVTTLHGNDPHDWGEFGEWSSVCPEHTAICGLQTRIEKFQGRGDDTALNDVKFTCCPFIQN